MRRTMPRGLNTLRCNITDISRMIISENRLSLSWIMRERLICSLTGLTLRLYL